MNKEFNVIKDLRPNLKRAVYHVSLNLPHNDNLSNQDFTELGNIYLEEMGFSDNQFVMYRHFDQEHSHIHIVANRVCFDGKVVSDKNNYKRSEAVIRKLEQQFNLSLTKSSVYANDKALTMAEIEKTIRTGQPPIKHQLQLILKEALSENLELESFIKELEKKEVFPKFNKSKSTGHISGISFKYKGIIYKGSSLGNRYSWNKLKIKLNYEQDRQSKKILDLNASQQRDRTQNHGGRTNSENYYGRPTENHGKSEFYCKNHKNSSERDNRISRKTEYNTKPRTGDVANVENKRKRKM